MDRQEQFEQFHMSWMEINAVYERYARSIGISYSMLQVLCELYSHEPALTQKEVCDICHLPKTTVNAIVSGLVKQGYALLRQVPEDRRQKAIVLTEAGREYAAPIMEHMGRSEMQAFGMLDEETAEAMLRGIQTYQKLFDEKLNETRGDE